MSHMNQTVRGAIRAATGLLIAGVSATTVLLLTQLPLPGVERAPISLTEDTLAGGERTIVCAGSFVELGADPARPGIAVPVGEPKRVDTGGVIHRVAIDAVEPGGVPSEAMMAPVGVPFAAAWSQTVNTDALRGVAASGCTEPSSDQWIVGSGSELGISNTLRLSNPGSVAATVTLTLYDESGLVEVGQTTGVLVPAGAERTVPLNGYAPSRERLAVRIESTGAAISASLGVGHTIDIQPFAADVIAPQAGPARTLVIPGVASVFSEEHQGDQSASDFPVLVNVLAPGDTAGSADVQALTEDGTVIHLGTIELAPGVVEQLEVTDWPKTARSVRVTANVPVVGAVQGSAMGEAGHDYAWFVPAVALEPGVPVAAAVVEGGTLVLANPGTTDVTVTVGGAEVTVPAGASVRAGKESAVITPRGGPIWAGVSIVGNGAIAGYPVDPAAVRASSITVFTR